MAPDEKTAQSPMLYVGPSPESVAAVRAGIVDILQAGVEQETLRVALRAFADSVAIDTTTITGCTVVGAKGFWSKTA